MSLRGYGIFGGFFGDGSDGDVKVTGVLNITRDMNYRYLILSGTAAGPPVIFTNSFRINVRDKLIFLTSGTFDCSGGSGSVPGLGATPPTGSGGLSPRPSPLVSGSLPSFGDGGNGALTSSAGLTGSGGFASFGGAGGAGASIGGKVGGIGGTVTTPSGTSGSYHNAFFAMLGCTFGPQGPYFFIGGAGGGGGASNTGSFSGSGGGGGAGVIVIAAREIVVGISGTYTTTGSLTPGFPFSGSVSPFSGTVMTRVTNQTGTFRAKGGNGANAADAQTGGGGGGGGGVIFVITAARPRLTGAFGSVSSSYWGLSSSLNIEPLLQSGTLAFDVTGGSAGTGGSPAAAAGGAGMVFYIDV